MIISWEKVAKKIENKWEICFLIIFSFFADCNCCLQMTQNDSKNEEGSHRGSQVVDLSVPLERCGPANNSQLVRPRDCVDELEHQRMDDAHSTKLVTPSRVGSNFSDRKARVVPGSLLVPPVMEEFQRNICRTTPGTEAKASFERDLFEKQDELETIFVNGEKLLVNFAQYSLLYSDEKTISVDGQPFILYHTKNDHSCLFHSLVLVACHFPDLAVSTYRNSKQMRTVICDFMNNKNKINDPWFIKLMELYEDDVSTDKDRQKYIRKMRDPRTWGSRIEIMIFCVIYHCNVLVAHTSNDKVFKFDSTFNALKLVETEEVKCKVTFDVNRVGHIANVEQINVFEFGNRVARTHFVYFRSESESMHHLNGLALQRTKTILIRLKADLVQEGLSAINDEFQVFENRKESLKRKNEDSELQLPQKRKKVDKS